MKFHMDSLYRSGVYGLGNTIISLHHSYTVDTRIGLIA